MLFRAKRNRRRVDVAKKTGELKAAARHHGPVVLKVLGLLLSSAALTGGYFEARRWALATPHLALAEVTVVGQGQATDVELVRLAGVTLGKNLLAMDVAAMERAISSHPWVKAVTVRRHLPSRLSIAVEEHRAVALLALGELYLVNEAGEPFKRVKAGDGVDLPLVTGIDREAMLGDREAALAQLRRALDVAEAYAAEPSSRAHPLSELHVHAEGVTAVTLEGQVIHFGEGELSAKLGRLARVRRELKARSLAAQAIHLDNRSRPSWVAVQLTAASPERGERAVP